MARVLPVGEGAGDYREEHVVGAVDVDDFGGPEGVVGRGDGDIGFGDVVPVGSAVGGLGDADAGAVDPGDAGVVVEVGAAVGVEHPPGFAGAVVDDYGIGGAVVDGVAEEGYGGGDWLFAGLVGLRHGGLGGAGGG